EQEYVDLLEEAFDLIGLTRRAASLPELQLRALREFVERLRQRRTGTKRSVREPAATSTSPAPAPSLTAPERTPGHPTPPERTPEHPTPPERTPEHPTTPRLPESPEGALRRAVAPARRSAGVLPAPPAAGTRLAEPLPAGMGAAEPRHAGMGAVH